MESYKLSKQEIRECLQISKSEFLEQIHLECSGCISALKDFITLNRKDKYITINQEIAINEDVINSQKISKTLAQLESYGELIKSTISSIFKKTTPQNNKKRCQLHSLKQVPEINIQEHVHYICNDIVEQNENCIIQDREFDYHLQVITNQLGLELLENQKILSILQRKYLGGFKAFYSCNRILITFLHKFQIQMLSPSTVNYKSHNLIVHAKCEIQIPYDAILLNALLNKAQIQPFYQHASTKEDAQEELLICFGLLIKEKLTTLYRERQTMEIIKYTFYQLENYHKMKGEYQSQLEELEQFLKNEDEQKNKQRMKRQLKKKKRKEQQLSSDGSVRTNYMQESSRRSISPSNSEKNLLKSFGWQGTPSVSPQTRKELEFLQKEHLQEINNRRKQLREQTKQCWCEWCHHHKQK